MSIVAAGSYFTLLPAMGTTPQQLRVGTGVLATVIRNLGAAQTGVTISFYDSATPTSLPATPIATSLLSSMRIGAHLAGEMAGISAREARYILEFAPAVEP